MTWSIKKKGPVFTSAFDPLLVVVSFFLQTFVLGNSAHLGRYVYSDVSLYSSLPLNISIYQWQDLVRGFIPFLLSKNAFLIPATPNLLSKHGKHLVKHCYQFLPASELFLNILSNCIVVNMKLQYQFVEEINT